VAQPCPTFQPQTYTSATSPSSLTSILGNPATVVLYGPGNDDPSTVVPMPIAFSFYGIAKTQIEISVNGLAGFAPGTIGASFVNAAPGTPGGEEDILMPWWDDCHTGAAGTVAYLVTGGGSLVIEWNSVEHFPSNGSGENATFQVVLNPSPANTIEFHYDVGTFASGTDPWTASIGIEDSIGGSALDLTGMGAANSTFPASNYTLTPGPAGPPVPVPTYTTTALPGAFSSIAGGPGAVMVFGVGVDDLSGPSTPLPAPFDFWQSPKATYQVNNNGFIVFNQALGTGFFTNVAPGAGAAPNDYVGPWWDDLHTGPAAGGIGSVWTAVLPGGVLAVEWNSMEMFPANLSGENVTIQLRLNPAPANTIEFHYNAATFSSGAITWSATIGVENATGAFGHDSTGLGNANSVFPATDLLLTPCSSCGTAAAFGAPCPSTIGTSGGAPVSPNLGFTITQSGAAPGVPSLLILGISNSVWTIPPPIPLPLPLATFGLAGGCSLRVSAEIVLPTATSGAGTSGFIVPVPPGLPACAATLYAQWANITAVAPLTVLTSNGLTIVTG
jgi:hypothetical protein